MLAFANWHLESFCVKEFEVGKFGNEQANTDASHLTLGLGLGHTVIERGLQTLTHVCCVFPGCEARIGVHLKVG